MIDIRDRSTDVTSAVAQGNRSPEDGLEVLNNLVAELSEVQKNCTETTLVLPPYDVRRTQEVHAS